MSSVGLIPFARCPLSPFGRKWPLECVYSKLRTTSKRPRISACERYHHSLGGFFNSRSIRHRNRKVWHLVTLCSKGRARARKRNGAILIAVTDCEDSRAACQFIGI